MLESGEYCAEGKHIKSNLLPGFRRYVVPASIACLVAFLASCQSAPVGNQDVYADNIYKISARSGEPKLLVHPMTMNSECVSLVRPNIETLSAPKHGKLYFENGRDHPNYYSGTPTHHCNAGYGDSRRAIYRSNPGFRGSDTVVYAIHFNNGRTRNETAIIDVK